MNLAAQRQAAMNSTIAVMIRLQGRVQGVGMRPCIWRLAQAMALPGRVHNDGADVLVELWADFDRVTEFLDRLQAGLPPLAAIEAVEQDMLPALEHERPQGFEILASDPGQDVSTALPDAATCPACLDEIQNPMSRRHRYAFASCTHCGPRLSIQHALPWDRAQTSMAGFPLCADCQREYNDPADRRFHAQPIACPACGPRLQLLDADGERILVEQDEIATAAALIKAGKIIALKGLGGFHLVCDAVNADAVQRLRLAKRRASKPFALMAADLCMLEQYCVLDKSSREALAGHAAPIVVLPCKNDAPPLAVGIAPGLQEFGIMLPSTPLHQLLLQAFDHPLVMTSGNLTAAPPCIDNDEALQGLAGIADAFLLHDRDIVNRVDDPVMRPMAGKLRLLRIGRGYAPQRLPLPPGLKVEKPVLAMGGELKAAFCLLTKEAAVVSQHIGDLEEVANLDDYEQALKRYRELFRFEPGQLAMDKHPEYLSRKRGLNWANEQQLGSIEVQHHHAHIAACLAENAVPLDAPPVLGIALDGLGMGESGELWGGEFLLADYRTAQRVGRLQPMPLLGGMQAMREPWRNTYAHLANSPGWAACELGYARLELIQWLKTQPLNSLDQMMAQSIHAPMCSSAGRWFDAVAGALGLCRERQDYEGQAAMQLEALVDQQALANDSKHYDFRLLTDDVFTLSPVAMWPALLQDLAAGVAPGVIAARFHGGLASGLAMMVQTLQQTQTITQVALSGGVFQNRVLFEALSARLESQGFTVLSHSLVPANDGGLALGQAVVAAARQLHHKRTG